MTQKSNFQNSYAPLLPHGQSSHTQSLSWSELSELYDDFPDDLCDRFELIAPLYDDGICDEQVTNELILHRKLLTMPGRITWSKDSERRVSWIEG